MNSDIRLAVSFRGHRKRKRLRLLLGPGSTDYLIDLWIATAMNHPNGILQGMDETDIALEAGWEAEPQVFVSALVDCAFLERADNGIYLLHDWDDHQGYVIHAERRKAQARSAAAARWKDREDMQGACCQHAESNAPTLPSPLPSPIPEPHPIPSISLPAPAGEQKQHERNTQKQQPEESEAYKLAELMRDTLKANLPTLKEPNLGKWGGELRRSSPKR